MPEREIYLLSPRLLSPRDHRGCFCQNIPLAGIVPCDCRGIER